MFDELKNLNIETCSDTELKAWVKQAIPVITTFMEASQRLLIKENTSSPCENCNKSTTCKSPCELLESLLPTKDEGKGYREKNIEISLEKFKDISLNQPEQKDIPNRDKLKIIKTTRLTDVYEEYKKCWYLLTDKQQEVVILRYEKGMTQKQIAQKTSGKRSAVSDILKRAKEKKEK